MARFLVVDDDHSTVHGLTSLLKADGHEVAPFTSGTEAVEAITKEPFDAVITDLEMPEADGHAVVHATRQYLPQACLVVCSSRATEHQEKLIRAGACIIADKPMDYDDITRAVSECRLRGGPGAHGKCYKTDPHLVQVRKRT